MAGGRSRHRTIELLSIVIALVEGGPAGDAGRYDQVTYPLHGDAQVVP